MQLELLPNLQRLRMFLVEEAGRERIYESEEYTSTLRLLSQLTTLTHLSLEDDRCPPGGASLAALTALRHLQLGSHAQIEMHGVWGGGEEDEEVEFVAQQLDAALPALQQLTCLVLNVGAGIPAIPAAVPHLPQLQRLFLFGFVDPVSALPVGFSSLQRLGASWEMLAASVPALAAMPQLRQLWVCSVPGRRGSSHLRIAGVAPTAWEAAWEAFWQWAAQHAPLQQLTLPEPSPRCLLLVRLRLAEAVLRLLQSRPSLSVVRFTEYPLHLFVEAIERD